MMEKISISQCMAEILCSDWFYNGNLSKEWNKMALEYRKNIVDGLKEYLISCVGKDMVIK